MPRALEIVHITDCHLLARPGARLHGHDVAADFDAISAEVRAAYPTLDAVVLGGDLVDDESEAGYRWLDERLAAFGCPVLAVAGNHDAPARMQRCLRRACLHDRLALPGWRLVGLDSHVDGAEHGQIEAAALAQLDAGLAADATPSLIVVHHPPVAVGSAWIDAIGLRNADALASILHAHAHVRGLLCGHVHQAARLALGACPVWTTPSTMRQFAPGSRSFAEDHVRRAGYRHLRLHADGKIDSRVHRLGST